ncbi:MAG: hypothetical protein H0V09_08070 [Gemmatimonadetes bacterium]|nr:hypothetical protein [Gemmatimonadota bacterium]
MLVAGGGLAVLLALPLAGPLVGDPDWLMALLGWPHLLAAGLIRLLDLLSPFGSLAEVATIVGRSVRTVAESPAGSMALTAGAGVSALAFGQLRRVLVGAQVTGGGAHA